MIRLTLSELSDLSAIAVGKYRPHDAALATGFTSLQRTVHVVIRPPDAEVEVGIGGA